MVHVLLPKYIPVPSSNLVLCHGTDGPCCQVERTSQWATTLGSGAQTKWMELRKKTEDIGAVSWLYRDFMT